MKNKFFTPDNSHFGQVLTDVMKSNGIKVGELRESANMMKGHICDAWGGKGDYHLSVYVRIVSALRDFFDPSEYERVKQRLMAAAFDDSYFRDKKLLGW